MNQPTPNPTTAGNWIGGALLMGGMQAAIHGDTLRTAKDIAWDNTLGK